MEFLNAKELADIFSVVAYGFVARWQYKQQVAHGQEEHPTTLIWAVVWSAVLVALFNAFNIGVPDHLLWVLNASSGTTKQGIATLINLALAAFLGFAAGRIRLGWLDWPRDKQPMGRFRHILHTGKTAFDLGVRDYRNMNDRHLNKDALGKWIAILTKSDKRYLGYVALNDAADTDDKCQITLAEVVQLHSDTAEALPHTEVSSMLISRDSIESIFIL